MTPLGDREAACGDCLRRSHLIAHLAPRITGLLARRGVERRVPALLSLDEQDLIAAVAGPADGAARALLDRFEPARAARELDRAGVGAACRHAEAYPGELSELRDPPVVVYFTGGRERLCRLARSPRVAVVGARSASAYALEVARGLGRGLGAAGLGVVSGLALGVDAAAHRGCLDVGGDATAVLAGGVDVPYPRANAQLYEEVRHAGCVMSELPPGRPVYRWSFPARNRIMAALAAMTVVVEAKRRSGSLITVEYAQDLGSIVGAVPGQVTSSHANGSNKLLRDGAAVIRGAEDVLEELFGVGTATRGAGAAEAGDPAPEGTGLDTVEPIGGADGRSRLEPRLCRVLDAVEAGGDVDAAGRTAGLTASAVRAALGRLELLGLVARSGVGGYVRTARPR